VHIGDGSYQMVAYLTQGGQVRIAFAEPHRGGVRGGGAGGWTAADLARRLQRRGPDLHGSTHGPEQRVFYGYADGAVRSVRVKGEGNWTVKMSEPWTPEVAGARPLRLLVVIDDRDIDVGDDGVQTDEMHALMPLTPELEPVYAK
jgi:hypothetical protein